MNNENSPTINDLEVSLVKTIVSEDLIENFGEISEALLDSELADGVIQNIPFFGILYKTGKIALTVKDKIFEKKILKFLLAIKHTTAEERETFIKELEEESGQKAGEVLIMLLDRLDNMEKPKIIANLLVAKIKDFITIQDFLRYSHAVDKGYLYDLKKIGLFGSGLGKGTYIAGTAESLFSLGLLNVTNRVEAKDTSMFHRAMNGGNSDRYMINKMGSQLLKYGIKGEIE